jgi:spore germination cell wall hydrolase CwlJ-like protein
MIASMCLALALYHEARGESRQAQLMVARVIINRVESKRWPSSVCGVVMEDQQFSFVRNGKVPNTKDQDAWQNSRSLAKQIIEDHGILPYSDADHYHTTRVRPVWRRKLYRIVRIDQHVFYSYNRPRPLESSLRPKRRPNKLETTK